MCPLGYDPCIVYCGLLAITNLKLHTEAGIALNPVIAGFQTSSAPLFVGIKVVADLVLSLIYGLISLISDGSSANINSLC